MVTFTAVTLGKGAAGKSRRPEGSRKERLRSFKHPGVRGRGLGLRGSHPPWGRGRGRGRTRALKGQLWPTE